MLARARAWLAADPDPETRAELAALLDAGDAAGLAERFAHGVGFGTAGLRAPLGAGPARMNRLVVRRAAAGLARWLLASRPGAADRGVAVGWDARRRSDAFAAELAAVLAAAGVRVHLLPRALPTPVLAFAVRHLGAAAGCMVTASHNPPTDNGLKVYLGDGAQVAPPDEGALAAAIDAVGWDEPIGPVPPGDPLVAPVGDEVVAAYLAAVAALPLVPGHRRVRVVLTPLHGVGGDVAAAAFRLAGFPPVHPVPAQWEPDGSFPTVAVPNPEEPATFGAALAEADRVGADLVLALDPDADRLGAAVPDPGGGWRVLRGDELGALLGDHVLRHTSGADRMVATTFVSSRLLASLAVEAGVHYVETLSGFKWIARAGLAHPGLRCVFAYEEALGYLVGDVVRDKDAVSAALVLAEAAAGELARGRSLLDRLDDLATRHGVHATDQLVVALPEPGGAARAAALLERVAAATPGTLGGRAVREVVDLRPGRGELPPANVVAVELDGARVLVRPSGTEPKLKVYLQVVEPVGPDGVAAARARAAAALADLRAGTAGFLGVR
ncbi:MAG: phospho-sugar mutase [Acidimicrobiales bacterium]|nr:phospho-sugar mutase [Acidimicrobiales bacterium]